MIFQALATHPDLWSLYRESQSILNSFFPTKMVPGESALVTADQVDARTAQAIATEFYDQVGNAEAALRGVGRGVPLILRARLSGLLTRLGGGRKVPPIRIIEKTPDNCFRIQMLRAVFPDAQFIYVVRDPRGSIASIHRGWTEESRFQRFPLPPDFTIADYEGSDWCFGLVPGWEELNGCSVMEICAHQWVSYNEFCRRDLPSDSAHTLQVRYEDLATEPGPILQQVAEWADLDPKPIERYREKLPVVNTWTKPDSDKWRRVEKELEGVLPLVTAEAERLGYSIS